MEPARHLLEYWAVLRQRRWAVYLAVAIAGTTAFVGSFLRTPEYRATATLQIQRQSPEILTFRDMASIDHSFAAYQDFYQTQYKLLASEAVARRAAERLSLASHPLWAGMEGGGLRAWIRALLPSTPPSRTLDPLEAATEGIRGALEVAPVRNSHLVGLSWVSSDPVLAADVANAVADAYIAFNIESSFEASDQASEFLVDQVATLRGEIAAIEARLQEYGEAKRIVSADDASNITMRSLAEIASRRTEARTALARAEAAWRSLLTTPDEAVGEVLGSDLIARLKQERAQIETRVGEMERLFKDDWPELQTERAKLAQANERLAIEAGAIARGARLAAEAEYRRARDEVAALDALLAAQERNAQTLRRDAVEFVNLQTEAKNKRATLEALITRQNEMSLSSRLKDLDVTSTNVRIVDRAKPPLAPFRPDRTLNTLLGLVLGLGLGVAIAFFLDYLDNTIGSPSEAEKATGLPLLASIPRHGEEPKPLGRARRRPVPAASVDLVSRDDPRAAATEAYRELRTALLLSGVGGPPRRISLSSALAEEGKSTTATNLATVLAQLGRKVLLVDADLRRPRLHRAFGVEGARGLSTYLSGMEDDPLVLVERTSVEGLALLASGPIPPNPAELLDSERFASFGARLLEAGFDHVLFDSPPVLSVADPVLVGKAVDAVLLVVRAHRTPKDAVRAAVEKLVQAKIRPVGTVLNGLDFDAHGYRAYHAYGAHDGHGAGTGARTAAAG
jgi:capsular exopolysaccharide synthesis family protein